MAIVYTIILGKNWGGKMAQQVTCKLGDVSSPPVPIHKKMGELTPMLSSDLHNHTMHTCLHRHTIEVLKRTDSLKLSSLHVHAVTRVYIHALSDKSNERFF